MGTLWLGGAEGLIAQNFTQITGVDTGFPEGGDFHKHPPPLDIVCVTSFALRKIEKHPPPTIAAAQKKDRRCPKNWVAQKLGGGCSPPPCPPASYAYACDHDLIVISGVAYRGSPAPGGQCLHRRPPPATYI